MDSELEAYLRSKKAEEPPQQTYADVSYSPEK